MARPDRTANSLPLWTISAALFGVAAAVNLQAPRYHFYTAESSSGTFMVTVIFAGYIVGLLPILALFGGLSARFGAKPVSIAAIIASLLATVSVTLLPSLASLLVARVLQGAAVGLALPAMTAWVAQRYEPQVAAKATATWTTLGFGAGAMLTSLVSGDSNTGTGLQSTPLSYHLMAALLITVLLGALRLQAFASGDPAHRTIRTPHFSRGAVVAGIGLAAGWGAAGLVVSMVPAILDDLGALMWSGPTLFLMLVAGAAAQVRARHLAVGRALRIGAVIQISALLGLVTGVAVGSAILVCVAAIAGGAAGHGVTLSGGLSYVATTSSPSDRPRAVAGYFLVGYLGFAGIPLIAGAAAEYVPMATSLALAGLVIVAGALFAARFPPRS